MILMGNRPSSRRVTIRLTRLTPRRLLAQNHPLQGLFGQPAPLAYRTDAGYQGVLGHFYRSHR